ncbi:MAG: iron-containing redox enzyme family protein [Proteobacteria bacterium]|nr:iron-containing redox enzyme family protein [Burkholderiales bacterium]
MRTFDQVYVTATGACLPGTPVDNEAIDRFIAPLDRTSASMKRRILADNGIRTRHYAIDEEGRTLMSAAAMAAAAARDCLGSARAGAAPDFDGVSLLCTASSGGDLVLPGLANMVQGELGAPPLTTASFHGVCAASMTALHHAALAVEHGEHAHALVIAAELPSRLFKRSRFAPVGYRTDFDAHFLRWMLSDGAGALRLSDRPDNVIGGGQSGVPALRLHWVHQRSFSGDYPVCMQLGTHADPSQGWLDYPSFSDADAAGALLLRQNIRLLPQLFDLAIHEYVRLVEQQWVHSDQVDHFLCHYSSQRFAPVVADCLDRARLTIPAERWYSNLAWRGNTGCASILIMLHDFLRERSVQPGDKVLLFVPESGRFTVAFALLEVVDPQPVDSRRASTDDAHPVGRVASQAELTRPAPDAEVDARADADALPPPPHDAAAIADPVLAQLLRDLAAVWHDYRSQFWRTPLVRRIVERRFVQDDYLRWMACWIPQVREGSLWMREAVANLSPRFATIATTIERHAGEEQFDFRILFDDYRLAGGRVDDIDRLRRNAGGEALNAYLHARAARTDALGLLGSIYVIEGTGNRIVPALLPLIRAQLALPAGALRFLHYHGENDVRHLQRWLDAVAATIAIDAVYTHDIVHTARETAQLYLMQMTAIE